jgi:two-component system, cell cycle sensor histidine kinase and response regulator CckA
MPSHVEQTATYTVFCVLVVLFTWIYLRDRQSKVQFWMIGWIAMFLQFTVKFLSSFSLLPGLWSFFLMVTMMEVAGMSFILSVSQVYATAERRLTYILLVGVPSVLYVAMRVWYPHQIWIFPALIIISSSTVVIHTFQHYGARNLYAWILLFALGTYASLTVALILGISPDPAWFTSGAGAGVFFFATSYFVTAGVIYWRHFRRFTPGVITASVAFLLWGSTAHLSRYLNSHHLPPSDFSFVWDLPKYLVAFGMILTLYEDETANVSEVAHRYRTLFEGNQASVYVSTIEGQILDCNSAFLKSYGYNNKEEVMAGEATSLYVDPADREAFLQHLQTQGHVVNYECPQRRKDGSVFWILERATIVTDSSGRKLIEGTAIDITERKQAELALKESEERFSTIFRHSPVGCGIVSIDGVFLNVNDALLKMFALPAEKVIGKTGVEFGLWKSQEDRDGFYRRLRSEGSIKNMEIEFTDGAGNRHSCLYFGTLVHIGDQECIFGMQLDLTEQRELEAKFLQAQKMEALGRLAGGVAHDFNNLLGVITGYAELMEARLANNETYRRYCAKIIDTTQRASGLTSQLLTFSRKEIARPAPLKPSITIRELANILSRLIGEDIEMVLELNATGTVVIDKTQFEQIVFNIVVNARDAMPSGGQLTIKTEDKFRAIFEDSGDLITGSFVSISITDTGIGMDDETRLHAFEPFFTTKTTGRGTGLGLATVYSIIQQCGGDINIKSRPGQGTTINLLLPVNERAAVIDEAVAPLELHQGSGQILLVEDEAELRNANAEFLTSLGYSVICARSGPEALQLASQLESIDLVISDVVMPKMNGREFTDRLLQIRPYTKVLFVSGYADDIVLQTGISTSGTPFLQKPYSLKQLGGKVQELLSDQAQLR